ncbi:MAG TPA: carbonic anhydrase [Blastocatellia bacterium]|nr:carbonic anhydrase [Blastocatellia bacterium]
MKEIAKFIAGFERFQTKYFKEEPGLFSRLRQDQQPRALVISCCDSRVDPALLMDADPGDLFVVRNVANLVPPYRHEAEAPGIRSAIEFAIKELTLKHIIVLGHSSCGGIRALMNGEGVTENRYEFIGAWVNVVRRAREQVLRDYPEQPPAVQAKACAQAAIEISLENLRSFPWIRERLEKQTLALHGWYFEIDTGEMLAYSAETGAFAPLIGGPAADQNRER